MAQNEEEEKKLYRFQKAQLYQMYYAINRLEATNFVNLDFTLNFGISTEVRADFQEMFKVGGTYEDAASYFATVPVTMLLKLYRYFYWAG